MGTRTYEYRKLGTLFFIRSAGGGVVTVSWSNVTSPGPIVLPTHGVADANYALSGADVVVYPTTLTAARQFTLPAASTGNMIVFADPDGVVTATDTITAVPSGTDKINGANSNALALNSAYMLAKFTPDPANGSWSMVQEVVGPASQSWVAARRGYNLFNTAQTNTAISVPTGAAYFRVRMIGGGGPGGNGFSGAPGGGGSGGNQGGTFYGEYYLANLGNPTTLFLTVPAVSAPGTNGGAVKLGLTTGPGNLFAQAPGGTRGANGTVSSGGAAPVGQTIQTHGGVYNNSAFGGAGGTVTPAAGNAAGAASAASGPEGGAGGGGGGCSASAESNGGAGGGFAAPAGGTAPGGNGTPGNDYTAVFGTTCVPFGEGGGGGAGNHSGTGGAGGLPANYGGGGGGGGGGVTGGAGANGGQAVCEIFFG